MLYYFRNQYAWNFFPKASRDKIREKLTKLAANYRKKHPNEEELAKAEVFLKDIYNTCR